MIPTSNDKYIGIEIECFSEYGYEAVSEFANELGLGDNLVVDDDGSIRPPTELKMVPRIEYDYDADEYIGVIREERVDTQNSYEFKLLTTEKALKSNLDKLQALFNIIKPGVNVSCGLHVHLDMRNRDAKLCAERLFDKQDDMIAMQPKVRRKNKYCKPNKSVNINRLKSRYRVINTVALKKYTTLEVRVHEGTVNVDDIYNWCNYLVGIVDDTATRQHRTYERSRIRKYA